MCIKSKPHPFLSERVCFSLQYVIFFYFSPPTACPKTMKVRKHVSNKYFFHFDKDVLVDHTFKRLLQDSSSSSFYLSNVSLDTIFWQSYLYVINGICPLNACRGTVVSISVDASKRKWLKGWLDSKSGQQTVIFLTLCVRVSEHIFWAAISEQLQSSLYFNVFPQTSCNGMEVECLALGHCR